MDTFTAMNGTGYLCQPVTIPQQFSSGASTKVPSGRSGRKRRTVKNPIAIVTEIPKDMAKKSKTKRRGKARSKAKTVMKPAPTQKKAAPKENRVVNQKDDLQTFKMPKHSSPVKRVKRVKRRSKVNGGTLPIQSQLAVDTGDVSVATSGVSTSINLLDYNKVVPKQTSITSYNWQDILPLTRLPDSDPNTPLEFRLDGIQNIFTDFFGGFLDYTVTVWKLIAGVPTKMPVGELVCPINLGGLTFFKNIEFWAGDLQVLGHHNDFPYICYNSVMLYASDFARQRALKSWGWFPDKAGTFNDVEAGVAASNPGAKERIELIEQSGPRNFIVPIMFDLGGVINLMPDRADLQLRFYRNTPEFWLMTPANSNAKFIVKLESAKLHMIRYQIAQPDLARLHRTLATSGFLMYANQVLVKRRTFLIGEQTLHFVAFRDVLPAFILVWFTRASAAIGDYHANPLEYLLLDTRRVTVYKNDVQYPLSNGLVLNDSENMELNYFYLLRNLHGGSPSFEPSDMTGGYNIQCYDMTAGNTSNSVVASPIETGTIRLQVDLAGRIAEEMVMFVAGVFAKNVKLTGEREMEIIDAK